MSDGTLLDGTSQSLYFLNGYDHAGIFKGMVTILEEHRFKNAQKLCAECKGFKCNP